MYVPEPPDTVVVKSTCCPESDGLRIAEIDMDNSGSTVSVIVFDVAIYPSSVITTYTESVPDEVKDVEYLLEFEPEIAMPVKIEP